MLLKIAFQENWKKIVLEINVLTVMIYTVLNKQDFEQELQKAGNDLVVIDFFANWCGPCKIVGTHLQEFSLQYADKAKFLKVNVDDCEDIAMAYNITSMPTFVFIKGQEIVDVVVGGNADELKKHIEQHINRGQVALEPHSEEDNDLQEDASSVLKVMVNEQI